MENKKPLALTIITWLFIVGGALAILGILQDAFVGKMNPSGANYLAAFCLPIGLGLLKTQPWAHLGAMILLCAVFIFIVFVVFQIFSIAPAPDVVPNTGDIRIWAVILLLAVLNLWCILTLNKESIRNLFKR